MRPLIYISTILILVINGIACACPSEMSVEDHASHEMHTDASTDDRPDCCDNCDEVTAVKMHGEFALIAHEKFSHHDFETPNKFSFDIFWDKDPVAQRVFANRLKPIPLPTPVMFFDRMLD